MPYGTGPWFMLQHCATHHGGCIIIPKGLCQMGAPCINWQESNKNDGLSKFPAMLCSEGGGTVCIKLLLVTKNGSIISLPSASNQTWHGNTSPNTGRSFKSHHLW